MARHNSLPGLLTDLWRDESGILSSSDYILFATILILGAVTGLVTMRDAVVQNLGDIAIALATLDQSYTVNYTLSNGQTFSFGNVDTPPGVDLQDLPGQAPYGIEICEDQTGVTGEN